ncbi:D-tyrosyl-tRNA(Tyr) deacylase (macronuclear) [Tetrahymena thermophila SB210]|uniref:D-aminoacyl-tRNA deacylase n=1 Tax=Tetrahymena thermophila (strain SB210) TaxID=312017 RepID=Q240V2_TETTS|nr:D-tyrosyl-tRNA(Tyr) deacylase [Tetrahymena thermophila SB210]EAS02312.3 D-tyrosyl-tRNA(Tyr) deacylase [Tetrahymena thermophila SB210]|eukprot:XP_001022557.3 D-tyrosyl-tRNA(Tyr) deacylase [Tetrahymena thermophila SB210]
MRLIIQRVLEAGVKVNGEFISKIGPGICILLGLHRGDNAELVDKWAEKALKLKLWPDMENQSEEQKESNNPKGKGGWKTGVQDNNYEVLVVSNFTLYGVLKGNKPDFHDSMNADEARDLYNRFMEKMQQHYKKEKVQGGQFQTYMNVHIVNDGPVTLCIDADEVNNMKQNQQKQKETQQQNEKINSEGNKVEGEIKEKQEKKQKNNSEQKNKQHGGEKQQKPQGENKQNAQGEHKQKNQGENKQKQQGEQKQKNQQNDQKQKPQAEQKQKAQQTEIAQKKQKPIYEEKVDDNSAKVEQKDAQENQQQE